MEHLIERAGRTTVEKLFDELKEGKFWRPGGLNGRPPVMTAGYQAAPPAPAYLT